MAKKSSTTEVKQAPLQSNGAMRRATSILRNFGNIANWLPTRLWLAIASGFTLAPLVVRFDAPRYVGDNADKLPSGVTQRRLWRSAIVWITVLPLAVWLTASALPPVSSLQIGTLCLLLALVPTGTFLFARRISAAMGRPMSVGQWMGHLSELLRPELPYDSPAPDPVMSDALGIDRQSSRIQNRYQALFISYLLISGGAIAIGFSPLVIRALPAEEASALITLIPWFPAVTLAAHLALFLPIAAAAARVHAEYKAADSMRLLVGRISAVLGISENEWYRYNSAFEMSDDKRTITVAPCPMPALGKVRQGMEERCEAMFGDWTVLRADRDMVKIGTLDQAGPEVRASRIARDQSGGMLIGYQDVRDTPLRPQAVEWRIAPAWKGRPDQIDAAGQSQQLRLVELDETGQETLAFMARLSPETQQVRARLAQLLDRPEHQVELQLTMVDGHIDKVEVVRFPNLGFDGEKRFATWRKLVEAIPGGSNGWSIEDDSVSGQVVLTFGEPRELPKLVAMASVLPAEVDPSEWSTLPLGIGPDSRLVGIDLQLGPHSLIVGPTGSGKTILLTALVIQALARGHQVLMVDPTKAGLDFLSLRHWMSAWADTLPAAQATIAAVYVEVQRRKAVLQREGQAKWSDLSVEVRVAEDIAPTTVIIDEFGSLVIPEDIPRALDRNHPYAIEANERNTARAILSSTVGRLAREARFAGIHLAIAVQRPDANIIGGELRSNLTSAVQLAAPGPPPSLDALRMVFPGELAPVAARTLAELNDGKSRGLAVVAAEGGNVQGFRIAYATAVELPGLLNTLGVPHAKPWAVGTPFPSEPESQAVRGSLR